MKKLIVCSAMMASLAAFAGSAGADGTDFVVTAAAGESYTNSAAIGDYARLVKRGVGEVVLSAATTTFKGSVVVETGTLSITDLKAVGAGTPVTVQGGATFWIKTPCTTGGQATDRFTGHTVTIAGKGVDDKGAFRYTQTSGNVVADSMLDHLVLADDATVEVASRWGMYKSAGVLDLAGHTLTRIGSSSWLLFNHISSSDGPGTIMNAAGTLLFQGNPTLDENVTVVVTNSTLGLWGFGGTKVKGTIKVYTWRSIQAQSGNSGNVNHLGNVHATGTVENNAILNTVYNNNIRSMSIDGTLTSDSGVGVEKQGAGTLWLNGDIDMPGSVNNLWVSGGYLYLTNNSTRNCRLALKGNATVVQTRGTFFMKMMRVSQYANAQFHQTGGSVTIPSWDMGRIGEFSGTRGYYTLDGGEFHVSNTLYVAERVGSFGAFRQTGGLFECRRPDSTDATFYAGHGGEGLFVQTGGTNDTLAVKTSQGGGFQMGTNGLNVATISGTGTLFRTTLIQSGRAGVAYTNILNIMDGAIVKANRFRRTSVAAGTRTYVNVDGATLMPTFAWGWTGAAGSDYTRSPNHFVVWKKGLVFDTSENAANSGTGGTEIPFWFESPTGKGVESVALPTVSGFIATNYMSIARVVFEDATGWGASAYAEYDFSSKKVTKIVVTSRGCDYSDGAKAYLESPDRSTRYECALTLSSNEGMCGEFIKRGAPYLDLFATNTVTGGIAVEGGMLRTRTNGVIPSNTPVRVESGATLDLYKSPITVSTFTGAGNVANGEVTVANAMRASCADIFAGKYATFSSNLTFAPGATFTITDPENLETYARSGTKVAFLAAEVKGSEPELAFEGEPPQGFKWALFKKDAGTYNFGAIVGTMLLIK